MALFRRIRSIIEAMGSRRRHRTYRCPPRVMARLIAVASLFAALVGAPAQARQAPARTESPGTLTIFAAASLTDAFRTLGQMLERQRPGLSVHFNFAGSQQLALQLEQGASADLFASADQRWMTYAEAHRLVTSPPTLFARNRLVVIVPNTNPGRIRSLDDLARDGTKLVLAADVVPAGKYSREVIRRLAGAPKFPPDYERRVLANIVSQEENVKAVVAKVQLGEADAGIVYRSDVTRAVARRVTVIDVPTTYNVLAHYPIAPLAEARNPDAARAFVALLLSAEGQRILRRYGFLGPA